MVAGPSKGPVPQYAVLAAPDALALALALNGTNMPMYAVLAAA
jgi:hypothetical protein